MPTEWRWRRCLIIAGRNRHAWAPEGTAKPAPIVAPPQRASSAADNQIDPQRQGPSVRMCRRRPAPSVMISPAPNLTPPQISAGPLPLGNGTRIMSAGTATRATRGRCSSAADNRRRCKATRVSRARNAPGPVTSRPRQPSSRNATSKSSASLNTEATLLGISTRPFHCRTEGAGCDPGSAIQFRHNLDVVDYDPNAAAEGGLWAHLPFELRDQGAQLRVARGATRPGADPGRSTS